MGTLSTLMLFCWLWFVVPPPSSKHLVESQTKTNDIVPYFSWESFLISYGKRFSLKLRVNFRFSDFRKIDTNVSCWLLVCCAFIHPVNIWFKVKQKQMILIHIFHGNSFYTNIILLALVCCASIHPANIWLKVKQKQVIS